MTATNADAPPQRARAVAAVEAVEEVLSKAERPDLDKRVKASKARLAQTGCTVLVVGEFKKGKSTLINALLNAPVCPVDDDVATAKPIEIRHAPEPTAAIVYRQEDLADTAPPRLATQQKLVRRRAVDDRGDRLRRQPGQMGELDLGQLAVQADQRQDQPLVIDTSLCLRAAAAPPGGGLFDVVVAAARHAGDWKSSKRTGHSRGIGERQQFIAANRIM